jgi:hypothetical protein
MTKEKKKRRQKRIEAAFGAAGVSNWSTAAATYK